MRKINKSLFCSMICLCMFFMSVIHVDAATYVANVRLYSTLADNHSWLVVKNTSSSSFYVGGYNLSPGSSVTIGTWGNINQHTGIWYNLEGYYNLSTHVSVAKNITSSEVSDMNFTINNNDRWGLLYNCSSFASSVWNAISSTKVSAGLVNTPSNLAESIQSKFASSYSVNYSIPTKGSSSLCYYLNNHEVIHTVPVFKTGSGSSSMSIRNINAELQFDNNYINSFY